MLNCPVRNITNKRNRKNTGFFPSEKIGRPVAFESILESDYLYLIEFDRDVVSFIEQPITIRYTVNGKRYKYTPDFKVIRKNKIQIIEIKPKSKLDILLTNESKKQKFLAGCQFCKLNGYEFKIITDEQIQAGFLLKNIKFLFAFSRIHVPNIERRKIFENLENSDINLMTLINNLTSESIEKDLYKSYILSLIYSQQLCTNLFKPLDQYSRIWLTESEEADQCTKSTLNRD